MIVLDLDKNEPAMVLDLTKDLPELKRLRGSLSWDPHPLFGASATEGYDLDIFLFGTAADGKIKSGADVVYFKNKVHMSGSYSVPVDNQTGTDVAGEEEDEYFLAELAKIPASIDQLHIYVFIHQADIRGQHFGMVANARFELHDEDAPAKADGSKADPKVRYQISQQANGNTALHVATIARNGAGWEVRPVGDSAVAGPNDVLRVYN